MLESGCLSRRKIILDKIIVYKTPFTPNRIAISNTICYFKYYFKDHIVKLHLFNKIPISFRKENSQIIIIYVLYKLPSKRTLNVVFKLFYIVFRDLLLISCPNLSKNDVVIHDSAVPTNISNFKGQRSSTVQFAG